MNLYLTALLLVSLPASVLAQNLPVQTAPAPQEATAALRTEANLVLVPTRVSTQAGETVFSLSSQDFALTDNGVAQRVTVDDDINPTPLSIVVAIETGGFGRQEIASLGTVETMLEAIIGEQPHEIALVTFDSQPHLAQDFTSSLEAVGTALEQLHPGDHDAAILDTLQYSVGLLQSRPASNRRVVLLISETLDQGSQTKPDDVFQTLGSANTPIYSVAFSTTKAEVHNTLTTPYPGRAKRQSAFRSIRVRLREPVWGMERWGDSS